MSPEEEQLIADWHDQLGGDLEISLLLANDAPAEALTAFFSRFALLAPRVTVKEVRDGDAGPSAIRINDRLRFHAVPLGTELKPFLEALQFLDNSPAKELPELLAALERIEVPAFVKLHVADQCPHCPVVTRGLIPLALAGEAIHLTVIDSARFPTLAEADQIQSVPTVLCNEDFRWTGQVRPEEVLEAAASSDPAKLSATVLEKILSESSPTKLVQMMIARRTVFAGFLELLRTDTWSTRLGAMVAFEELVETDRVLARQCVEPLWQGFDALSDPVKGDVLYISGEAGDDAYCERIRAVAEGKSSDELKEVARDALESIAARDRGES